MKVKFLLIVVLLCMSFPENEKNKKIPEEDENEIIEEEENAQES